MKTNAVKRWLDSSFDKLHPQLQTLHLSGGTLQGSVEIRFGNGLANVVGKRLARKMNIPDKEQIPLTVNIQHSENELHWNRIFDNTNNVNSVFIPIGTIQDGYWIEKTGPITLKLTIDIIDGGWFWRCIGVKLYGFPIPTGLIPKATAYKTIENEKYRFYVGFHFPILGLLFSYSGLLNVNS